MNTKFPVIKLLIGLMMTSYLIAGGTISGTIKFEGKVPLMKKLRLDADPVCAASHGEAPRAEWLLVGENGGVKNMLVYIQEGLGEQSFDVSAEAVVLDQKGCVYTPHVVGIHVGQTLKILNSDETMHNIHARPKVNKEFNKAMPKFKKELTVQFDKTEAAFPVKCDVHPWMKSWIQVFDHPFFTVTDDKGSFSIPGLRPGSYVIEAWHEKLGTQQASITIGEGETKTVDFTFTRPAKKK